MTCFTAGLYMVFFKRFFAHLIGSSFQMLFSYFVMKGMSVAVLGGLILLFLPESHRGLPTNQCGWTLLSINMLANTCFNLSLAWGTSGNTNVDSLMGHGAALMCRNEPRNAPRIPFGLQALRSLGAAGALSASTLGRVLVKLLLE